MAGDDDRSDSDEYNSAPDSSDDDAAVPKKAHGSDDDDGSESSGDDAKQHKASDGDGSDDGDGSGGDDGGSDDSDSDAAPKKKKKHVGSSKKKGSSKSKKVKDWDSAPKTKKDRDAPAAAAATTSTTTTAAVAPIAGVSYGRKLSDDEGSDGWSDDEKPKKISKRQYKKDRRDELGRIFDRGNFRDEVCGTIDVTLVQGRELLMDKKTKKSPSGKGLYLKCVLSFPKNEPLTSDIGITDEEGEVTWQYLFPTMLVYQKSGNVANSFFKYPRLLMKVRQKGLLSKTISRGELPLGPIIAPKPSEPGDEDEDPLKPNADGECVVPMLNSARVRMGEVVVIVKFRRGVQQRKPL